MFTDVDYTVLRYVWAELMLYGGLHTWKRA